MDQPSENRSLTGGTVVVDVVSSTKQESSPSTTTAVAAAAVASQHQVSEHLSRILKQYEMTANASLRGPALSISQQAAVNGPQQVMHLLGQQKSAFHAQPPSNPARKATQNGNLVSNCSGTTAASMLAASSVLPTLDPCRHAPPVSGPSIVLPSAMNVDMLLQQQQLASFLAAVVALKSQQQQQQQASQTASITEPLGFFPPGANNREDTRQETLLENEWISCFEVGGEKRLCLPQILSTVLVGFSIEQINAACQNLRIHCGQCSRQQLEVLKVARAVPANIAYCSLIRKTDAERLVNFLIEERQIDIKCHRLSPFKLRSLSTVGLRTSTPTETTESPSPSHRQRTFSSCSSVSTCIAADSPASSTSTCSALCVDKVVVNDTHEIRDDLASVANHQNLDVDQHDDVATPDDGRCCDSNALTNDATSGSLEKFSSTTTTSITTGCKRRRESSTTTKTGCDDDDEEEEEEEEDEEEDLCQESNQPAIIMPSDGNASATAIGDEESFIEHGDLDLNFDDLPVYHECFGRCRGSFKRRLYCSPASECIECSECGQLFAPYRFVLHSHRNQETRSTCHWGFDSANWRSYLHLGAVGSGLCLVDGDCKDNDDVAVEMKRHVYKRRRRAFFERLLNEAKTKFVPNASLNQKRSMSLDVTSECSMSSAEKRPRRETYDFGTGSSSSYPVDVTISQKHQQHAAALSQVTVSNTNNNGFMSALNPLLTSYDQIMLFQTLLAARQKLTSALLPHQQLIPPSAPAPAPVTAVPLHQAQSQLSAAFLAAAAAAAAASSSSSQNGGGKPLSRKPASFTLAGQWDDIETAAAAGLLKLAPSSSSILASSDRLTTSVAPLYDDRLKSLAYINGKDSESGHAVASCIEPLKKHLLHKNVSKLIDKIHQNGKTCDVDDHHQHQNNGGIIKTYNNYIPVKTNGFYEKNDDFNNVVDCSPYLYDNDKTAATSDETLDDLLKKYVNDPEGLSAIRAKLLDARRRCDSLVSQNRLLRGELLFLRETRNTNVTAALRDTTNNNNDVRVLTTTGCH